MKISGNIKDFQNEPLMGANVFPIADGKSIQIGTTTDFDGNFELESDKINDRSEIKITYLGFKPQIKFAEDLDNAQLVMEESTEELDEVLIIAKKKKPKEEPTKKLSNLHLILIGTGIVTALLGLILYNEHKNGT